jgi:hypothetical protein
LPDYSSNPQFSALAAKTRRRVPEPPPDRKRCGQEKFFPLSYLNNF